VYRVTIKSILRTQVQLVRLAAVVVTQVARGQTLTEAVSQVTETSGEIGGVEPYLRSLQRELQ
jgi:hypothetical protein